MICPPRYLLQPFSSALIKKISNIKSNTFGAYWILYFCLRKTFFNNHTSFVRSPCFSSGYKSLFVNNNNNNNNNNEIKNIINFKDSNVKSTHNTVVLNSKIENWGTPRNGQKKQESINLFCLDLWLHFTSFMSTY